MKTPADVDLVREALITFIWDGLDKIVAFVAFVYFANYFTSTSFGTAYTVIGISVMASSVPNAIAIAIQKRISENVADYERFFSFGITLIPSYALVVGIVAFGVTSITNTQFEDLLIAGTVHLVGRPFLFHVERLFDGVGSPGTAAGLDFVDGLLTAVLRFVLILGLGVGAAGLLYSAAISGFVVGATAYFRRFGIPRQRPTRGTFHDIKEFSRWTLLSRVSTEVFKNSAVALAGTLVSPSFASYVKAGKNLIEPARIPVRSVIQSIFIQISASTTDDGDLIQPIQSGIDVACVFAIPLSIGALVVGDPVMATIYGSSYQGSGYVLVGVAAAFVFEAFSKILSSGLNGSNNPDSVARSNALVTVISLPAIVAAILFSGQIAFLVVLVASYAFQVGILLYYVDIRLGIVSGLSWRFPADQLVSAINMGLITAVLLHYVPVTSWPLLVATVGFGAACYSLLLLTISPQGRRITNTILAKITSW